MSKAVVISLAFNFGTPKGAIINIMTHTTGYDLLRPPHQPYAIGQFQHAVGTRDKFSTEHLCPDIFDLGCAIEHIGGLTILISAGKRWTAKAAHHFWAGRNDFGESASVFGKLLVVYLIWHHNERVGLPDRH